MTLGFSEIIGEFLFAIAPPIVWAVMSLIGIILTVVFFRVPASAAGHLGMILILLLATSVGGIFNMLGAVMAVLSGAVFLLGAWKIIGQR